MKGHLLKQPVIWLKVIKGHQTLWQPIHQYSFHNRTNSINIKYLEVSSLEMVHDNSYEILCHRHHKITSYPVKEIYIFFICNNGVFSSVSDISLQATSSVKINPTHFLIPDLLSLSSMSYRIQANSYQMRPNSWKFDRHIRSSTLRSHWYTLMRVVEFWCLIFLPYFNFFQTNKLFLVICQR